MSAPRIEALSTQNEYMVRGIYAFDGMCVRGGAQRTRADWDRIFAEWRSSGYSVLITVVEDRARAYRVVDGDGNPIEEFEIPGMTGN